MATVENRPERTVMIAYRIFEDVGRPGRVEFGAVPQKYAWLEHDGGMWHLLTSLFGDPADSERKWDDEQNALRELEDEGWVVVYPYDEKLPSQKTSGGRTCGYGLMWIDQRLVS